MRKAWPYLLTLLVIGGCASIAVPNLLNAMNRARQKRTMADMRTIGAAWEARVHDLRLAGGASEAVADFSAAHRIGFAELERLLVPKYARQLPRQDGWKHDFEFAFHPRERTFAVRSRGSDGRAETNRYGHLVTTEFAADVVLIDGAFIRYPEGI